MESRTILFLVAELSAYNRQIWLLCRKLFLNDPASLYYDLSEFDFEIISRNGGYFEYKPMFIEKIPIVANNNLKLDTVYRNNDNIICKLYSLNDDETSYIINKKFK